MKELRTVVVMSLGFGLVGIDRFLISTLYPVIARELNLNYGDIGIITGALAIAWGTSALLMGNLSDRIGRRHVLVSSMVVFSLLIGASGLASGLLTLIMVRIVMGFADGAYTPVSIACTLEASAPQRVGLNIGVQQMMMPLFGLGLAPLFVAFALHYIDWRWVFLVFVLPGLALAVAVRRAVPPRRTEASHQGSSWSGWRTVLRFRNVRIAAPMMLCWLTCLVTTSAFMPNYLIDHLKIAPQQMGVIMSAIGLGATAGTFALPWLSDTIGRKRVMQLASAGVIVSLLLLTKAGAQVSSLFAMLFAVHFFNNALIALTVGPLSSESVPPSLMATASGLVIAVGELFGGGIAPVVVGNVAQRFGIENALWLPIIMMVVGFLLCHAIQNAGMRPPALSAEEVYS
ncbi:MAG TPA: MFS transporter [Steroidobacteraceae bacterium]